MRRVTLALSVGRSSGSNSNTLGRGVVESKKAKHLLSLNVEARSQSVPAVSNPLTPIQSGWSLSRDFSTHSETPSSILKRWKHSGLGKGVGGNIEEGKAKETEELAAKPPPANEDNNEDKHSLAAAVVVASPTTSWSQSLVSSRGFSTYSEEKTSSSMLSNLKRWQHNNSGDDNRRNNSNNTKGHGKFYYAAGYVAFVVLFSGGLVPLYIRRREWLYPWMAQYQAKRRLATSRSKPAQYPNIGAVVDRSELVDFIHSSVIEDNNVYVVVYGPNGAGKTVAVGEALKDEVGVVNIKFDAGDDVVRKVAESLGLDSATTYTDIISVLEGAVCKPTLCFEVEKSSHPEDIEMVGKYCKRLVVDENCCNCVITISKGSARGLPSGDDDRQLMIWVDDPLQSDIEALFDTMEFLLDEPKKRQRIFDTFGTRVGGICGRLLLQTKGKTGEELDRCIDGEITKRYNKAYVRIAQISEGKHGQIFTPLMKKMIESYPEGVPRDEARRLVHVSAELRSSREDKGVMYHVPSKSFRFSTPIHYRAAKDFLNV